MVNGEKIFFILSTYIRCIILSNRFLLPGSVMFSTFSSSREAFALIFKLSNKDGNETRIICVNFAVNGKNFFIFQSVLQMGRDQEKCMQTNVQLEWSFNLATSTFSTLEMRKITDYSPSSTKTWSWPHSFWNSQGAYSAEYVKIVQTEARSRKRTNRTAKWNVNCSEDLAVDFEIDTINPTKLSAVWMCVYVRLRNQACYD